MKNIIVLFILISLSVQSFAQQSTESADSIDRKKLLTTAGIETGFYIAGISFLNFVWYKDHDRVPFHFYDDSKGWMQMDKGGHSYAAYKESYFGYHALRAAGVNKKKSLIYGGSLGFILQAPIEVLDGMYEGYGFSWPDIAANTLGVSIFIVQEAVFDEQVVLMKFSYYPSIYPDYYPYYLGETELASFFMDYNAHTYWLSANLKKITGIHKLPPWLNIAFGYSANGMIAEFKNPTRYPNGDPFPYLERYRQFVFSLDIDFTRIPTKRKWVKGVFTAINLIKVPFPALEINKVDGLRFRYLYY
ncbi:MAG: DUF2279 domain-containing protein [Bacteroidota bacterium]